MLVAQKSSVEFTLRMLLTFTEKVSLVLFINGASKDVPVSKLSGLSDLLKGIEA